ncbi:MAG TPA: methanogenesis marker 7 protein [Methanosphaera sp.]|jgi:putative methanogenesis marker protein 7|nr:methanogenesis marker 7 protein [Methanosphaera sp.]HIJ15857.1 methanogenesis marker 7 protein [Methanosphaera sp.]
MYETLTYTGGIHKHYEIEELIEDLGGFILQRNESQLDITLTIAVPAEDVDKIEVKAKDLLGDVEVSPLASTEIAVVSPTLARQHLPHAACDIAEYLRRYGTKTNMIGLARGAGKGISQISKTEKDLIEEHDLAIFSLGSFEDCIRKKTHLFEDIDIPVIVVGSPELEAEEINANAYVSGFGRIPRRLKRGENIRALRKLAGIAEDIIAKQKEEQNDDPLITSPVITKIAIERGVEEIEHVNAPMALVSQLDGVRVKLPFDEFHEKIAEVDVEGRRLGDIAEIKKSKMYDHILVKILPETSLY